ncbi:EAL domain-containing protein [Sulfurimonas sp.]
MKSLFNQKLLRFIPFVFFIVAILRIIYDYTTLTENKNSFVAKEAEVLNAYAVSHREYYQKLFIDKVITLDENTLKALPAYSSRYISDVFSANNSLNIIVKTVSDNPRNSLNQADKDELLAIKYFKKNRQESSYFNDKSNKYYQYASALRIEKKCLLCHGKKEDAPHYISSAYDKAYNYKLGELRGIISIKVPKSSIETYFFSKFVQSIFYDLFLFILLYIGIAYLVKKTKDINNYLRDEVDNKTKQLRKSLVCDKLTDLFNRRKLLQDTQVKEGYLAIFNIDNFKDINDFYGHETGDYILKEFGARLIRLCKCDNSEIYKLPGDEFAIFVSSSISQKEFIEKITEILSFLHKEPFSTILNDIYLVVTCGISSHNDNILITADIALQKAKKENIPLVVYGNELDISKRVQENIAKMHLLKDAFKSDNVVPYFQPIYNLRTKAIEKYECLVRIIQADGSVILPGEFLTIAIKSKQYPRITKIMVEKSFEYFKNKPYEFSINLSICDMKDKNMVNFLQKKIESFPSPQRVIFEILESEQMDDYKIVKNFISLMKKYDCKFALDDFGSGYSNFAHVYRLDMDCLKIDGSLIENIAQDEGSQKITQGIVEFARSVGMQTIAEFVEDEASLKILQQIGVDYIQGYYIGKPSPKLVQD